jgi:hypothetical protein
MRWLVLALALVAAPVRAQVADSARVGPAARPARPAPFDTTSLAPRQRPRPPISAKRAFLQSFLIPGWGQIALRRSTAGGLFAALEVTSIAMLIQSKKELSAARAAARDSVRAPDGTGYVANPLAARIDPRKQAVEDWTALLIFTHLLAGADAFVAAQLWDVPVQVEGQASRREARLTARIPF